MTVEQMKEKLATMLTEHRYVHSLGVMETAVKLANLFGEDTEKARIAGLLHDCAKCIPNSKKLKLCEKHNIQMTELERRNPFLLHAKLGAFLAMHEYDIHDKEIISAILTHTTGKPEMSLLDKIVFVADYIEPGRDKAKNLPEIRRMAYIDLDRALYQILKDTLSYLHHKEGEIDDMTQKTFDYYRPYFETNDMQEE